MFQFNSVRLNRQSEIATQLDTASRFVSMDLRLPSSAYREPRQIDAFYAQTLECVRALPRVTGAAIVEFLPFSGLSASTGYSVDGHPPAP
jgi:hypothetical protein